MRPLNIQYAIAGDEDKVYILEANPRASRTVPLVSKVCGISMVPVATEIIMGELSGKPFDMDTLKERAIPHYGVKEAVLPFNMFPEVDPLLGPEMLSTGEVLGLANSFGKAYLKAQEAAGNTIPVCGGVFISVNNADKEAIVPIARRFVQNGYTLISTSGTAAALQSHGVPVRKVRKLYEGESEIPGMMENGDIALLINTPSHNPDTDHDDSYIRKTAIRKKIPYVTTVAAACALIDGIAEISGNALNPVKPLQQYLADINII